MISLAYPYLLLLPFVWLLVTRLRKEKRASVSFPSVELLASLPRTRRQQLRSPLLFSLQLVIVILLSLAAARPQQSEYLDLHRSGRDLMLAIDISGSMREADLADGSSNKTRIDAVKQVVRSFILERADDRLGLVLFGPRAFLQSPLTRDHAMIEAFLSDITAGATGDGTAIGDGLALALKRLENSPERSRAIILVTDGANNSGRISPVDAAIFAAKRGVIIHSIGIGGSIPTDPTRAAMRYDEALLRSIAEKTKGVFFNADSVDGLQQVYDRIDELERADANIPRVLQVHELFWPLAAAAAILYLLYLWIALKVMPILP